MAFVIDASIAAAAVLPDERLPKAIALIQRAGQEGAWAPSFFPIEVANALLVAHRRGRIDDATFRDTLEDIATAPVALDQETAHHAFRDTPAIARQLKLTAYDAAYLELAQRKRIPLATLDSRLADAARAIGVSLL